MSTLLEVEALSFSYGDHAIVENLDLVVDRREVVALMGPSGCGKSTLLRLVTGLEDPAYGMVRIDNQRVTGPQNGVFLGFQDFDSFPWLTVTGNVEVARKYQRKSNERKVDAILNDVGLEESKTKFPSELSGGMRKRLAFARCLASGARLVLLDEPFASLDVKSRIEMQHLLHRVVDRTSCAVIIVTHDAEEAAFLATRIVLCDGPPLAIRSSMNVEAPLPRSEDVITEERFEHTVLSVRQFFRKTI